MKQAEYSSWKATFDIRKRPINGKLFQNQKTNKEEFILNTKKTLGKKYMQDSNIFKQKLDQPKKQHRQVVMSEQFIRSSKFYRLLRQKMDRCDSMFIKQVNTLNQHKQRLKQEIAQIKSQNYQEKIGLWELKNRLMQLKAIHQQEEEESRRLSQTNFVEYEEQQAEMALQDEPDENERVNQQNLDMHKNKAQSREDDRVNSEQDNFQMQQNSGSGEVKKEFSQILQELMSLKAERQRIKKEFCKDQPQGAKKSQDQAARTESQSQFQSNYLYHSQ